MTGRTIEKGLKEAVYVAQGRVLAYHVAAPGFDPPIPKREEERRKAKNRRSGVVGKMEKPLLQIKPGHKYSSSPGPLLSVCHDAVLCHPDFPIRTQVQFPPPGKVVRCQCPSACLGKNYLALGHASFPGGAHRNNWLAC